MTKKITKLIFFLVTLIVVGIVIFIFINNQPKKDVFIKCVGYNKDKFGLVDCEGIISVSQWFDIKGYYVYDHAHDYELAEVDSKDEYRFEGGQMYVKNRAPLNCSASDTNGNVKFCQKIFQNGQFNYIYYNKQSDIPLYLIIDSQTGELRAFKTMAEMSETEKEIFQKLEEKVK